MLYHPSSVTSRAFSRRTVNGRLRRLAMFYHWAFRQGLVASMPLEYDTVRAPISAISTSPSAEARFYAAAASIQMQHVLCGSETQASP